MVLETKQWDFRDFGGKCGEVLCPSSIAMVSRLSFKPTVARDVQPKNTS